MPAVEIGIKLKTEDDEMISVEFQDDGYMHFDVHGTQFYMTQDDWIALRDATDALINRR